MTREGPLTMHLIETRLPSVLVLVPWFVYILQEIHEFQLLGSDAELFEFSLGACLLTGWLAGWLAMVAGWLSGWGRALPAYPEISI